METKDMDTEDILLTNKQLAVRLGITEQDLRTLKSRNKEALVENTHWLRGEGGLTLWTTEGEATVTRMLNPQVDASASEPSTDRPSSTVEVEGTTIPPDSSDWIDQALQPHADQLAMGIIEQRLPVLVMASLQRMLLNPDPADSEKLQGIIRSFGSSLRGVLGAAALSDSLNAAIADSPKLSSLDARSTNSTVLQLNQAQELGDPEF